MLNLQLQNAYAKNQGSECKSACMLEPFCRRLTCRRRCRPCRCSHPRAPSLDGGEQVFALLDEALAQGGRLAGR